MTKSRDAGASRASQSGPSPSARPDALTDARADIEAAIAKATTEAAVYHGLCGGIARRAGLPLVWIGMAEPGNQTISVQAAAGDAISLLDEMGIGTRGMPLRAGTISQALHTSQTQIEENLGPVDGESQPRIVARAVGIRSYAAFPIRSGHMVIGVLQCMAREQGYFGPQQVATLEQLVATAAHRLADLESESRRRRVEQRLTASEQRYRGLFELAPVAIMVAARGGIDVNRALLEMFGYADQAALESAGIMSIIDPSDVPAVEVLRASLGPVPAPSQMLQTTGRRSDGSTFPLLLEGAQIELDGAKSGLVFLTDLTALEAAETASRQSRNHLKALVDGSPLAIVSIDLEGFVRSWNVAAEQIFGWTSAEVIGRKGAVVPAETSWLIDLGAGEAPHLRGHAVTHKRRDGSPVDLRVSSAPLFDRDGNPSGSMLVMEDVTEIRQSEEALRMAESRYRAIVEQAPLAIAVGRMGLTREVNDQYRKLFGLGPDEELTGQSILDQIAPQERETIGELVRKRDSDDPAPLEYETVGLRTDGSQFPMHVAIVRMDMVDGPATLGIFTDLTSRRQAERDRESAAQVLRESEEKFAKVFRDAPVWISITDLADGNYVEANEAVRKASGYSREELLGHTPVDLGFITNDQRLELLRQIETNGRIADHELTFRAKDGRTLYGLMQGGLMEIGGRPSLLTITVDVTERKRAEAETQQLQAQLLAVVDGTTDPIWSVDPVRFGLLAFNGAMSQIFDKDLGIRIKLGDLPEDIFPTQDLVQKWRGMYQRVLSDGPFTTDSPTSAGTKLLSVNLNLLRRDDEVFGISVFGKDVTEQRRADERFRNLFDLASDAIFIRGLDGRFLEVNRTACERLGYSRDELLTMSTVDIDTPENKGLLGQRTEQIATHRSAAFETAHVRRDGTVFPVEISSTMIDFDGRKAILSIARDIAGRKADEHEIRRSQDALELSEAKYSTAFRTSPDAVNINRLSDGLLLDISDGFTAMTGLTRADVEGKTSLELGIWVDTETRGLLVAGLLNDGVVQNLEMRFRRKDGSIGIGLMSGRFIEVDGEKCILTITRDITARQEAEDRFQSLFEHAGDALFIIDQKGHFLDANRAACERLGYTREEMLSMSAPDIDTPERAVGMADRIALVLERGTLKVESSHVAHDGHLIPTEVVATQIVFDGKPAILSVARDLTERRRAEAEKAALMAQLLQAQKMEGIGRLAGGIAHDFNNLLTAIRGNASLALAELPPDAGMREDLEQIQQAADRAAALTRQLLAFARRTVLQPEVVDLGEIVRRLEPMLNMLIGEDVELAIESPEGTGSVLADPGQIEQIVVNLVVNARDAMPDGGRLTISVADREGDGNSPTTGIAVTDTGIGMDNETLSHLFEPFFTTKDLGKGTGLGLATVYGIVHQSGGTVAASSRLGSGSTFTILLPRLDRSPQEQAKPLPSRSVRGGKTGTILVVEDDAGVRRFATRVLEDAGYRVLATSGGVAAITAAHGEPLQLLLTDVVMPGMGGREVATKLAEHRPGLRVLYMSGHADKGIVKDGVLEPGIDLLAKPFTADALLDAVENAMRRPLD